jgi:multidrug efflux pump subunit AcrB
MFALPFSIIGVAFSLWAFKKPISLGVWIGMMILFGSVVYGSIILVEKINTRRKGRKNLVRVVFESCRERLRPELITLLMKTLGLVPMVLSRDEAATMWRSLGLTILFGTISGTVLTLLIVPVGYITMELVRQRMAVIVPHAAAAVQAKVVQYGSKIFSQLRQKWQLTFNKEDTTDRIE